MILLDGVTKTFSGKSVLSGINLSVGRGEVVGFLGPNGAGKTTTLRLIIGYLRPDRGSIRVNGLNPEEEALMVKSKIGYLAENNPLYLDQKVFEYLYFIARIKYPSSSHQKELIERASEACGLNEVFGKIIGELSRGYKQRVGLAAAIIGDPDILILDEPTSGLDPNQIIEIRKLIRNLGRDKTIILSTHIIPEVSQTCNRVVIIHQGKIAADKRTSEFQGEEEFHHLTKEEQL